MQSGSPKTWSQAARDAPISGTSAAVLSTVMLTLCGLIERGEPVGPHNGPSQWLWGEQEAYVRRLTVRHTLVGYIIHHLMSVFWAVPHERWLSPRRPQSPARALAHGALTAGVACFVDYQLTPRRLRPGFEKHLNRWSLLGVYAAFGLGLALPDLLRASRSRRRLHGPA